MNVLRQLLFMTFVCGVLSMPALMVSAQSGQDSFNFSRDTTYRADSLYADSMFNLSQARTGTFGLLDTISNDTMLRSVFKNYSLIRNVYFERKQARRDLPTVKEVRVQPVNSNQWKFWVILFILAYIAFVRISNSNNFRVFILSVFNLKLSRKIWDDQRSFFGFVIVQLFAIYVFIAAMFITNYMELKQLKFTDSYLRQFAFVLLIILAAYFAKFFLHMILGWLLKMQNLAVGFISNTISVNNFVALVIFPFAVFSIYANNSLWANVLSQTIIAIFMLSILYRVVRIVLLSNSFFSFPTFYLFLYLCALEIAPWFIIVKFLTSYNI